MSSGFVALHTLHNFSNSIYNTGEPINCSPIGGYLYCGIQCHYFHCESETSLMCRIVPSMNGFVFVTVGIISAGNICLLSIDIFVAVLS